MTNWEKQDIQTDRINYIVHLQDEEELFWIIPQNDDGSDKWVQVQAWLDEGNTITDDLEYLTLYSGARKIAYNQLNQFELMTDDAINGTTSHLDAIQAIKDKYPKPE